jgi:hypothetical protein
MPQFGKMERGLFDFRDCNLNPQGARCVRLSHCEVFAAF